MATITPTFPDQVISAKMVLWETMADDDVGAAVALAHHVDATAMIIGTYGGATVTIEGSLDGGTTWVTLDDAFDNVMSYTVNNQLHPVGPTVPLIRPQTAGGSGTDIDVYLFMRNR